METIINELSLTKLIDKNDISKLRNYIDNKYSKSSRIEKAKILSNSIHSILDRSIKEFDEDYRNEIKTNVIKNTILNNYNEIYHKDILNTCIALKINEERFIDNLQCWIVNQAKISLPKELVKNILNIVDYNDNTIDASTDTSQVDNILPDETIDPKKALNNFDEITSPLSYSDSNNSIGLSIQSNLYDNSIDIATPTSPIDIILPDETIDSKPYLTNAVEKSPSFTYYHINSIGLSRYFRIEQYIKKYYFEPIYRVKSACHIAKTIFSELDNYIFPINKAVNPSISILSRLSNYIFNKKHILALCMILSLSVPLSVILSTYGISISQKLLSINGFASNYIPFTFKNTDQIKPANTTESNITLSSITSETQSSIAEPEDISIPKEFKYIEIDHNKIMNFLNSKNSILAEDMYLTNIILASKEYDINPYLLLAIAGQEQSFVPKNNKYAVKIANNPFNVYHSWKEYNTDILDSSRIVCRTIINLLKDRPEGEDPFVWLNRSYAEDKKWWIGVKSFFTLLSN